MPEIPRQTPLNLKKGKGREIKSGVGTSGKA
jgi:hypothetical protein